MTERASGGGESGAATGAATGENLATCLGGHACAETVPALALDIRRLKCLLHLKKSTQKWEGYCVNPGNVLEFVVFLPSAPGKRAENVTATG